MSRRQFRATVEDRPAAAWVLVSVASALLWITEQLAPWVIAVEVVAIVLSLVRRGQPFAWQSSPIALNIGMFGIASTTIALALDGNPATISLAHFAALTQGLQLLDSRPRKSEFLLVTLALFQVILAANLTDSLLFPPLLVLFVVSAVWTLLVHTLRSESIEAGDPGAASGAITPGLRRMTAFASVASIVLALILFMFLPRMRTSMLQSGFGRSSAVAGFSNHVELGTIGRIRSDRTIVLRVQTLAGRQPDVGEAYWRGLAFDAFDGRSWAITPTDRTLRPGSVKFGIQLAPYTDEESLVQQVVREPVASGVIFGAGRPLDVSGALLRLETDVNGGLYDPLQTEQRIRYTIRTAATRPSEHALRNDETTPPERRGERYLALPDFDPAVHALAARIIAAAETDAARATAIEAHLRENGRYTDTPPPLDGNGAHSPIEGFLTGELSGHCEYFASGMVVLARSAGLPARLVNGFAGGRVNPLGGFVELARSDAHAWVEIHYRDAGWVRYDPTPPDLRLRPGGALSFLEHIAALNSTVELWWFQRVVDFDSSDQIAALKAAFGAWRKLREPSEDGREKKGDGLTRFRIEDSLLGKSIVGGAVALGLAAFVWSARRRKHRGPVLPSAYAQALRLLARHGLVRAQAETARQFAATVAAQAAPNAARPFRELTESYLAERFGGRAPTPELVVLLATLRTELKQPRHSAAG